MLIFVSFVSVFLCVSDCWRVLSVLHFIPQCCSAKNNVLIAWQITYHHSFLCACIFFMFLHARSMYKHLCLSYLLIWCIPNSGNSLLVIYMRSHRTVILANSSAAVYAEQTRCEMFPLRDSAFNSMPLATAWYGCVADRALCGHFKNGWLPRTAHPR